MKRFVLLPGAALTLGLLLITAPFALAGANQLNIDYFFDRPDISEIKIEGELYHRMIMPDVPNCGNPGQPSLPARGAKILLPFGSAVSSIEVVPGEKILIDSDLIIEPVSYPVKLSAEPGTASPPIPDGIIYSSDTPFPESRFENIGTQGFRGYQILILKLQPVEYIPKSRELYYYSQLTVIINTADADKSNDLFRGLPEDEEDVITRVDNPEQVSTYFAGGVRTDRSYEFLIITTSSLVSAFQPLENYHDNNGLPTAIRTTTDIGSSNPDDIRAYITSQYSSDGIQYVLIGADDDIIPAKDLYVAAWSGGDIEYNMPADIYYGCLDGTYNYDGDSYWGEPNDGNGGGDVDLVAEVYIGRAAVGNTTEANRFVNKTIWYLTNQHTQIANVLMVGEYLGFGGESDYAGNMMDQIVDGSSADSYTTIGIPSDIYNVGRLYERDWSNWPQSELVSRINGGLHIINHLGHGSPDKAMKLYDSDIMNQLTNNDLCFVYSQTCLAGHFDGTDCWAEYMNIKTDNGGFAVVMNARYGWGLGYSTDGPSQRFDRQFWDAVFNPSENKMELSKANQDSKEDNLYRINESCMRWCTYELNLFGDPTVAVKEISGLRVRPSANFESEGNSGGPFSPSGIVYTLENTGDYSIDYNVTKSQPWITLTNASGTIPINGTIDVTVTINTNANSLPDGSYEDIINFINTTDHIGDTQRNVILTVGIPEVAYEWTFDTNPGWTTQNQWAFGSPTGNGGEYGGPDPSSGHTGSNVYGYNLNGDYANYMSETHLTSNAIDCSGLSDVTLKFWRWLGVEQPAYDHAYVRISSNGYNWTTVWQNTAEVTDYSWTEMELDISSIADDQATVYLRWTMGITDVSWRYCGWNIDDIQILALGDQNPTGSIAGVVDDAETSLLIQGVTVEAIGSGVSDITDANGEYALENIIVNTYSVSFSHEDYEDTIQHNVVVNLDEITILNMTMVELPGSISGAVTDASSGEAIAGVTVEAVGTGVSTVTNELGQYTLSDLDAGTYDVLFTHGWYYNLTIPDVIVTPGDITPQNAQMTILSGSIYGVVTETAGIALSGINKGIEDKTDNIKSTALIRKSSVIEDDEKTNTLITNLSGPIEGVLVTAIGTGISDVTDENGFYELSNLSPGFYDVSFSHPYYEDLFETGVEVIPNYITMLNVSLIPLIIADVGVSAILNPPDSILFETPYPLEVEVANHGVGAQTFDVVFEVYISGSSVIESSDIVTVIDMPRYSADTVTFSGALIPEINADYDLVSYTTLATDEDNGNDTASTTSYTKEGVLVKYGNLDGSPINGPINGNLTIDVYVQTSENAYLGDFHLCLGSDDQYIDDHLSETLGQVYYPLTEWEAAVFTAPHGSPPNPEGWTSQSFVGFARINPNNPNPLWLHLESLTNVVTFVFEIVDEEALIGQTLECLGQGLNLYQGPSNGSDSTGFTSFDIVESYSPVQFYDPTAYCDYVPGDFNGDGNVIGGDVTFGVQFFIGVGSNPPDSCWLASSGSWLYSAADANGDCVVIGSDITYLVAFFVGTGEPPQWCPETPPANPLLLEGENEFDTPCEPVRNR